MSKKVLNQLRARETLLNFRAKSFDCDVYKYIEECTTQKLHLLFILVWLRFFSWQNAPVGVCIFVSISVSEQMNLRRKRKCLECQDHLRFHPPLIIFLCVKVGVGILFKRKNMFSMVSETTSNCFFLTFLWEENRRLWSRDYFSTRCRKKL